MSCNHKFQGHKDGVTCVICGVTMTPEEYAAHIKSASKPKPAKKKKEATDDE